MKIAFYKGSYGTFVDKLICVTTFSEYSHCEIVFENGECGTSSYRDGGVRLKFIPLDHKWDVIDLPKRYSDTLGKQFIVDHIGMKYDYLGAIGAGLNIDLSNDNRKFCSKICSEVLGLADTNLTPGELYFHVKYNLI